MPEMSSLFKPLAIDDLSEIFYSDPVNSTLHPADSISPQEKKAVF